MKKITLAAALLLAIGAQAQTFPAPYCEIADEEDVLIEEITTVSFADASIVNTDVSAVLINATSSVASVSPGEIYTIEVGGNTEGEFETDIVAFIDWNQNDILDDDGEVYAVGTLFNTDGTDGISVSLDITVPTDAVLGETRIRITKTYRDDVSTAVTDPCGIKFNPFGFGSQSGYGQALDFTLNLATLSTETFERNALAVYPNPTKDVLNIDYRSNLTGVTVYNVVGQEVLRRNIEASQLQLDLSEFTSGVYIVKLLSEEGQHSFRVVKE
ncbi:T9SS type A sorting domain-containing protein [Winogradskyella wichelsiae]|uniref:T9SS type A sorting domain-containing protein n=1 Tax=Winogradskyella wichelsiae TaxID=2697007 RepID=UPI0015CC4ABA|nr:T9SS type A sorting domain-containing protein [Winogradskyella wichelsiae]